jgi:hypothetical protein
LRWTKPVDGQARERAALEGGDHIGQGGVLGHSLDVGARRHHVDDAQLAQAQDVRHHRQLGRRARAEGRPQRRTTAHRALLPVAVRRPAEQPAEQRRLLMRRRRPALGCVLGPVLGPAVGRILWRPSWPRRRTRLGRAL